MHDKIDSPADRDLESKKFIELFLAGDPNAFNNLILLHKRMVFNLCFRLLGDYDDADDCAQEVFIKVSRALKNFRFESSFKTWIYRIAVNTCKNRLNSLDYRLRSKRVRINVVSDMDNDKKPTDIKDPGRSPAAEAIQKEVGRLIQSAINALPAKQKLVVVLRDIEARSYEEIVELTGLKMGTVKSKLSRARLQLRELLKGKI